jgi:hypothetical protein
MKCTGPSPHAQDSLNTGAVTEQDVVCAPMGCQGLEAPASCRAMQHWELLCVVRIMGWIATA